ncbi:MAG: DUF4126 family protein [Ignavibacteria bacterium]
MEIGLGILLGIGLAASCGFRVFLPMLVTNIASCSDILISLPDLNDSWHCIAAFLAALHR